jgi:hypothetical protein
VLRVVVVLVRCPAVHPHDVQPPLLLFCMIPHSGHRASAVARISTTRASILPFPAPTTASSVGSAPPKRSATHGPR